MKIVTVHNGKWYREVIREANKGDAIIIINVNECANYSVGEIFIVNHSRRNCEGLYNGVYVEELTRRGLRNLSGFVKDYEYIVLEPIDDTAPSPTPTPTPSNADRIAALETKLAGTQKRMAELERELRIRDIAHTVADRNDGALVKMDDTLDNLVSLTHDAHHYAHGWPKAIHPLIADLYKPNTPPTYTREQVVEMARQTVEYPSEPLLNNNQLCNQFDDIHIEYHVNRDKGRVTCVVRGVTPQGRLVRLVGRSQVGHRDTFNVWLGKAVSAYRAFGLDVPGHFVNAPQPTVAQVGDVVWYNDAKWRKIDSMDMMYTVANWFFSGSYADKHYVRVLDDSHDFGSDNA